MARTWLMRLGLPLVGLAGALLLWSLGVWQLEKSTPIASAFAPLPTALAFRDMLAGCRYLAARHAQFAEGGRRPGAGDRDRRAAGRAGGDVEKLFSGAAMPLFQLLRMISPLSWMPIAVMVLGVGDAPVYFLLAFAAVWPILLNTAAGVARLDPNWLLLARSLSATRGEIVFKVILPGITADISDRRAPGDRHYLDRAGAGRNAGRVGRPGLLHPRHARPPGVFGTDGGHRADRHTGFRAGLSGQEPRMRAGCISNASHHAQGTGDGGMRRQRQFAPVRANRGRAAPGIPGAR